MGYSRAASAALRFKRFLDDMVEADGKYEVVWTSPDAQRLSRQIREAMVGAVNNIRDMPDPKYANLVKNYKICVKNDEVLAKPRVDIGSLAVKRKFKGSYDEVLLAEQVVEKCIMEPHADELLFRNFIRSDEELAKLEKWISTVEYKLIDHGVGMGVTIVKH